MKLYELPDGLVIEGRWPDPHVVSVLSSYRFPLVVADPPYGRIVKAKWDRLEKNAEREAARQVYWAAELMRYCLPSAALYWFGGYGKPNYRIWYRWILLLESHTDWRMAMPITWSKKRAYGVQNNYLSTREEIAYCVLGDPKKPRVFDVPYTDELRGYAGYDPKHPAKSDYKRRTAVWDITEILRGKKHVAEKPFELLRIPIETHTHPGEIVLDLFAGSGACSLAARRLGRKFVAIEEDPKSVEKILERLT